MSTDQPGETLTHFDTAGHAVMVDVSGKTATVREAVAEGFVYAKPETLRLIAGQSLAKGDVLGVARLAGIMGGKQTSALIPLCHPLPLSSLKVDLETRPAQNAVRIVARAKVTGLTGVEMEALTAVTVAALTVYDMAKAADKTMRIGDIRLLGKTGGKSGTFNADAHNPDTHV